MVMLVVGCASLPPYQHMSDARQAIAAAEGVVDGQAGAEALLDISREHLDAAGAHLEAGAYEQAREEAGEARRFAIKARETAAGKARAGPGRLLDR